MLISASCCTKALNHHPHMVPDLVQVAVTAPEHLSAAGNVQKSAQTQTVKTHAERGVCNWMTASPTASPA